MLEQVIQLTIILFLLSMICERISDFFKHYLNNSKRLAIGDTITKYPINHNLEQARYYRIFKINIWCGFFTAAILKADLFLFLREMDNPGATIGWSSAGEYNRWELVSLPFGIFFTGCFISFGSKFWHDLLDLLLQVKETKRKIGQVNELGAISIEEVDRFVAEKDRETLEIYLNSVFGGLGISTFVSDYDRQVIDVYPLASTDFNKIPKTVPYKSFRSVKLFTVVVHQDPGFKTQEGSIFPATQLGNAANNISIDFGSLGIFVWNYSKTIKHLLTCYHVVWKNHSWDFFQPNGNDDSIDLGGNKSRILKAFRNVEVDIALLDPPPGVTLNHLLPPFIAQNTVLASRAVTQDDKVRKSIVRLNGVKSGIKTGRISDVNSWVNGITYPDGRHWSLQNVIVVNSADSTPFSQSGDSGSIVFDENNIVIGMLVAGSSITNQSIVIPFTTIENQLLIKL